MEIIEFGMAIFATYRMAQLLPEDYGPFFTFSRLRFFARTKMVAENREYGPWANFSEGIHCVHCMGLYAAFFCGLLMLWHNFYGNLFLLIMAIAGGQSLLEKLGERNE